MKRNKKMRFGKNRRGYGAFVLLLAFLMMPAFVMAAGGEKQKEKKKERPEIPRRVYFGGNLGLQFGTITDIMLSPMVGYRITPRLSAGLGFTYEYYEDRRWTPKYTTHLYGPRAFARYLAIASFSNILPINYNGGIFFHGEYEALNMDQNYFGNYQPPQGENSRFWMNSWLLGLGLRQPISATGSINFLVLFYLGDDTNTPYSNPIFRIEFSF